MGVLGFPLLGSGLLPMAGRHWHHAQAQQYQEAWYRDAADGDVD